MEEDEIEIFASSTSYIESLTKAFRNMVNAGMVKGHKIEELFEEVIQAELELALMGAEKAKQKATKNKDNIKEFKK